MVRRWWSLGSHFINSLWAHNWNLVRIITDLILMAVIPSGRNVAHAMTAELSWHVQNCGLIGWLFFMLEQNMLMMFGSWARKLFVKWCQHRGMESCQLLALTGEKCNSFPVELTHPVIRVEIYISYRHLIYIYTAYLKNCAHFLFFFCIWF